MHFEYQPAARNDAPRAGPPSGAEFEQSEEGACAMPSVQLFACRVTRGLPQLIAAVALVGIAIDANAQATATSPGHGWPSKAIRYIVPFPPGGATDILARSVADKLGPALGQPVVVENKPGAAGNVGTEFVARATPDGYTILMVTVAQSISDSLYAKLGYSLTRDLVPVALVALVPNVMVVNPSVPAHTVKEFISYAKANPGKINFASSGSGTSIHMSGELFKMLTGVDMVHVPYKGSALALTDLISGQ